MRLCLRMDILFILLMLFSLLSVCVFSSHVIPALAGAAAWDLWLRCVPPTLRCACIGLRSGRPFGTLLPLSLRVIARRHDEAIQINSHPTGLCLMETCLILRTLACFLLRAQKYRKKLVFGEEKQFFHERLAGWEKGCNYILADMFLQNITIPHPPHWVYGTGTWSYHLCW